MSIHLWKISPRLRRVNCYYIRSTDYEQSTSDVVGDFFVYSPNIHVTRIGRTKKNGFIGGNVVSVI